MFICFIAKNSYFKKKRKKKQTIDGHSQNAGLRPAMLAIAVSVRLGNFGKFVVIEFYFFIFKLNF